MTYLLDTMIVAYFIQANHRDELAAAAACCPMAIVDEVRRELEKDRRHGGAFKKWLPASKLGVRAIEVGSDASNTLARLRNPASPDKNLGERASIALASTDTELTFVTHDLALLSRES